MAFHPLCCRTYPVDPPDEIGRLAQGGSALGPRSATRASSPMAGQSRGGSTKRLLLDGPQLQPQDSGASQTQVLVKFWLVSLGSGMSSQKFRPTQGESAAKEGVCEQDNVCCVIPRRKNSRSWHDLQLSHPHLNGQVSSW